MADLTFDCIGAQAERYAVLPTISLALRISETSGQRIDTIALRCQIRIEPSRRRYTPDEEERLRDLFGETTRWADTLKPMQFTNVTTMVTSFTGSTEVQLPVNFSYDLEIGSGRYFASLEAGEIPLLLLFSGTVFSLIGAQMSVTQVPWSKETSYRLPVSTWREAIDAHFPNSSWIRLSSTAMDELLEYKTRRALPTWEATVLSLLDEAAEPTESA